METPLSNQLEFVSLYIHPICCRSRSENRQVYIKSLNDKVTNQILVCNYLIENWFIIQLINWLSTVFLCRMCIWASCGVEVNLELHTTGRTPQNYTWCQMWWKQKILTFWKRVILCVCLSLSGWLTSQTDRDKHTHREAYTYWEMQTFG